MAVQITSPVVGADITEEEFDGLWGLRSEYHSDEAWKALNEITRDRACDAMDRLAPAQCVASRTGWDFDTSDTTVDKFGCAVQGRSRASNGRWFHLWLMYDGTKQVILWTPEQTVMRDAMRARDASELRDLVTLLKPSRRHSRRERINAANGFLKPPKRSLSNVLIYWGGCGVGGYLCAVLGARVAHWVAGLF